MPFDRPLPVYAATKAEVDDAKREKDRCFGKLAAHVQDRAEAAGVAIVVDIRPGRAADLITRYARAHAPTWSSSTTRATSSETTCWAPPPTASPIMRTVPSWL